MKNVPKTAFVSPMQKVTPNKFNIQLGQGDQLLKSFEKSVRHDQVLIEDDMAKRPSLLNPQDRSKFTQHMDRLYPSSGTENGGLYSQGIVDRGLGPMRLTKPDKHIVVSDIVTPTVTGSQDFYRKAIGGVPPDAQKDLQAIKEGSYFTSVG